MTQWSVDSWRTRPYAQEVEYEDPRELDAASAALRALPPIVTSFEIERLRAELAAAERGERFVLQGGDCAETLADCRAETLSKKLKILLQMSLVLVHGTKLPVTRIGRFAGQYAKPRSRPTETIDGVTLPSYFGDLINRPEFSEAARRADPWLLVEGLKHAALTMNFVRSLADGGFADLYHPEYWDLRFLSGKKLSQSLKAQYEATIRRVEESLSFMNALGQGAASDLSRVDVFASHEGLNLHYESALTRTVPRRAGFYDLSTHLPWIGDRTRQVDGAHIEFFRGVRNPIGCKVGPSMTPHEIVELSQLLNPENESGKLVLISRMGRDNAGTLLPSLVGALESNRRKALWLCDPMHGNTQVTDTGKKTRAFDDILTEIEQTMDVHHSLGTVFGGVHFEMTGEDVTECIGGADGLSPADLDAHYTTACDPRLNYAQALEMSFRIARRFGRSA